MKIRKISRGRPRSVDDAELGHFTLSFCRGRRSRWLSRCLRRRGLLKLPFNRRATQ